MSTPDQIKYVTIKNTAAFAATVFAVVYGFELKEGALLPTYFLGEVADDTEKTFDLTNASGLGSGAEIRIKIDSGDKSVTDKTFFIFDKSTSVKAKFTVSGTETNPQIKFEGLVE